LVTIFRPPNKEPLTSPVEKSVKTLPPAKRSRRWRCCCRYVWHWQCPNPCRQRHDCRINGICRC
jgi:hypothetical protein